jgi:hypothetical protein
MTTRRRMRATAKLAKILGQLYQATRGRGPAWRAAVAAVARVVRVLAAVALLAASVAPADAQGWGLGGGGREPLGGQSGTLGSSRGRLGDGGGHRPTPSYRQPGLSPQRDGGLNYWTPAPAAPYRSPVPVYVAPPMPRPAAPRTPVYVRPYLPPLRHSTTDRTLTTIEALRELDADSAEREQDALERLREGKLEPGRLSPSLIPPRAQGGGSLVDRAQRGLDGGARSRWGR